MRPSGRARDNRLVHVTLPDDVYARPGVIVEAEVTHAAPHHLVADRVFGVRDTPAGDAWEARDAASCGTGGGAAEAGGVLLGMPTIGAPVS